MQIRLPCKVPFPAVSKVQYLSRRPWDKFADHILSNARYDCFDGEGGGCRRARGLLEHAQEHVDDFLDELFHYLNLTLAGGTASELFEEPFRGLFCQKVREKWPRQGNGLMRRISDRLAEGNDTGHPMEVMKNLTKHMFRLPEKQYPGIVNDFFGFDDDEAVDNDETVANENRTSSCYDPRDYDDEIPFALYTWFFILGTSSPEVQLSQLVWYNSGWWGDKFWDGPLTRALKVDFWSKVPGNSSISTFDILSAVSYTIINHSAAYLSWRSNFAECWGEGTGVALSGHRPFCQDPEAPKHCCTLENEINNNFRHVLKIMKHTLRSITFYLYEKSEIEDIKRALEAIDFGVSESRPMKKQFWPSVLGYQVFGSENNSAATETSFVKYTYSDEGLSLSFNTEHFWHLYRRTPDMELAFAEMFEREGAPESVTPLHPPTSGLPFGFEVILDVEGTPQGERITTLMLHEPHEIPKFKSSPIWVKPAFTYIVAVTPSKITVDKEVDKLLPRDKGCMSTHDLHNLTLFRTYSQANCMYECQLKDASRECGCIPWNYPRWSSDFPVCHHRGSGCFIAEMRKGMLPSRCSCMVDCTSVTYSYTVQRQETAYKYTCSPILYTSQPGIWRKLVHPKKNTAIELHRAMREVSWHALK